MLTLITGAPGTGKSAALVSMLSELASDGRQLYVHGIPDLKINHEALAEPHRWPDLVPDGSIIIIDEVQNVWRPRGPGQKVPDHVAALETHRHRGLDFSIITQGPNLVDSNVRALVGRQVHLRDLGILGRWWYEWPECADNCRTAWKNAPIKKRYRLPKAIFGQYKSASIHVKPVRSVPWMLAVMALALITVAVMSWVAFQAITKRMNPTPVTPAAVATLPGAPVPTTAPAQPTFPAFIDDRVAFMPRISTNPETAPAYDALRVVVNMPQVVGGVCFKGRCKCVTQQGTDTLLSHDDCHKWMQSPPFDNYRPQVTAVVSGSPSGYIQSSTDQTSAVSARSSEASAFDGASNPRAQARPPALLPVGSPVHAVPAAGDMRPMFPPGLPIPSSRS
jgi:zona occludens toxin